MAKFLGGRTMEASEGGVSTLGAGAVLVDWVGEQTAEFSGLMLLPALWAARIPATRRRRGSASRASG